MKYVIEHLEPRLSRWCLIEYSHLSKLVGKDNLWFTHVKKASESLGEIGRVFTKPAHEIPMEKPCVLDPEATKELTTEDCKVFSHLVFGGILGDHPPRARTREVFPGVTVERRHLGPKQMSTDTAVHVAKLISEGKKLSQLPFLDEIEIEMGDGESVLLPYRYLSENGKPILAPGLVEYLKKKRGF